MTTLATLLRLDDEQLGHFRVLTGATTQLSAGALRQCRQLAHCLERWLDEGADTALQQALHDIAKLPVFQQSGLTHFAEHAPGAADAGAVGQANEGQTSGTSTRQLDQAQLATILSKSATPFQQGPAALPPSQERLPAHPGQGETGFAAPAAIAAAIQQTRAGPPPLPMSVHDYAALVAHTEQGAPHAAPAARQLRHQEHNIEDEAHRTAVDETFSQHFRCNHQAWNQYAAALQEWRLWLKRGVRA